MHLGPSSWAPDAPSELWVARLCMVLAPEWAAPGWAADGGGNPDRTTSARRMYLVEQSAGVTLPRGSRSGSLRAQILACRDLGSPYVFTNIDDYANSRQMFILMAPNNYSIRVYFNGMFLIRVT